MPSTFQDDECPGMRSNRPMFCRLGRAVVAGTLVALTASASAVAPSTRRQADAHALMAASGTSFAKPLRAHRKLAWGHTSPGAAWQAFAARRAGKWQAAWDSATGVPSRIWGEGIPAPGTTASAQIAEQFARQVLADHLALLAPGSAVSDFELVSNHFDGSMRSIGFIQRAAGKKVVGGQVSFRFKADRLFVIGSEALPNVAFAVPRLRMPVLKLSASARDALRAELGLPNAPVSAPGEEVVLPLVADDTVLGYRVARPMTIDGGIDGRYLAYVDVVTGAVIATKQLNLYANGTVKYRVVDRYPARTRIDRVAQRAFVNVNGAPQTTTKAGAVSWGAEPNVEVETSVAGDLVSVVNKATGNAAATARFPLTAGGAAAWDASGVVEEDAQVNAYVATMIAKEYVRDFIDPAMPTLDDQMAVNVNIAQSCNAFFDGQSINFFQANDQCQNTALLEDVVYHEYGHRLHTAELIPGVGDFDGAMSEGASDFLAASITGDPGMGRGFFYVDEPLRDLEPGDSEWSWPRDVGEIHHTGMIYGGIFWDLRKALIEQLGPVAGVALVNKIYLGTLRRAISIPTSLIEALAEDDDDGNLTNGTPNECAIRDAYGLHGIRTATGTIKAPGTLEVKALSIGIHIDVTGLSDRCAGDEVAGAEISWLPGYGGIPQPGTQEATPAGTNKFFAQLPLSPQETVYYKAKIKFADGSVLTLADNYADPYYQLYQGDTVKLYCTNFDAADPFAEGWTTGTDAGDASPFAWGPPAGGATDPRAAFSGTNILGMTLGGNYNPDQRAWLNAPVIEIGRYSDVRLQYRRWLSVEDSHFDQAKVTANGKQAWLNLTSDTGDNSALHHIDKEWRFHDVALSSYFSGHEVTVGWEITSDQGLELGGWQMDDVCIVANPYAICGDGVKTPTEQCDTGLALADKPDVCRTDCRLPKCGDQIIDMGEQCDEGPEGDALCTPKCETIEATSGCCSSSGGSGSLALAGLLGAFVLRRRRRR